LAGSETYVVFVDFVCATFVVDSNRPASIASHARIAILVKGKIIGSLLKTALFLAEPGAKSIAMHLTATIVLFLTMTGSAANAGDFMKASELEETFRGITLDGVYSDDRIFTETYFDDGSIRYRDDRGADTGDWSVRSDKLCTFYGALQGGCFFIIRESPNCFVFFGAIKGADGRFKPSERWTARGWNRQGKTDCMKSPEAVV
jgi:hypothetical protein